MKLLEHIFRAMLMGAVLALAPAFASLADDVGGGDDIVIPDSTQQDPVLRSMQALNNGSVHDMAPLWDHQDPELQAKVDAELARLGLAEEARRNRLGVALVDITDLESPRVASVNGDLMMYAASLPKIAVLLGVFDQIGKGRLPLDWETTWMAQQMIHRSSNKWSTELMHKAGKQNIALTMLDPRYRLYDPRRNGGLWAGKDYAKGGLWRRDPLYNLSHSATPLQVARFYYLLETGNLVSPELSAKMREIMSRTEIEHKFIKGIREIDPEAQFMRKSGSWRNFHSDSVLIRRQGRAYIAVALSNANEGKSWLVWLIQSFDRIIFDDTTSKASAEPESAKRSASRRTKGR